jgi:tetratricopeptide (TPR) repeat protein
LSWYGAIEKGENWPAAQLRVAVLQAEKDLPSARTTLQNLQQSVSADQSIIDGYMLEAELLNKAKNAAEAKSVLSAGLKRFPEASDLLYSRAMTALGLKDVGTMESDLKLMTELDPDNAQAWNALGYSLLEETDRVEEAYEYIQQAYALDPKSGAIQDSLGWANFKRNRLDQAVPQLRQAYASEPGDEVAAHLGEALWQLGAKKEAIEIFSEASKKYPDSLPLKAAIKRLKVELP